MTGIGVGGMLNCVKRLVQLTSHLGGQLKVNENMYVNY